jgi:hypothetical protein
VFLGKRAAEGGGTYNQVVRVAIRYIDQRPQRMHERFEALAMEVMYDALAMQVTTGDYSPA